MKSHKLALKGVALTLLLGSAQAQAYPPSSLMQLGVSELRSELDKRYNEAVQVAKVSETLRADSARFIWANEAKAQCGIAIGFTKAGKKDEPSVSKCDAFAARLAAPTMASAPVVEGRGRSPRRYGEPAHIICSGTHELRLDGLHRHRSHRHLGYGQI